LPYPQNPSISLSWPRRINSTTSVLVCLRPVGELHSHLLPDSTNGVYFWGFPTKTLQEILLFLVCASRPASFQLPWFHHQDIVWRGTKVLKLLIMQTSQHNTYKWLLFGRDVNVWVSHNQLIKAPVSRNWRQSTRPISQQTETALWSTSFQCCYNLNPYKIRDRSHWPRGLRSGSSAACLLGLWVRIPQGGMDVCLS